MRYRIAAALLLPLLCAFGPVKIGGSGAAGSNPPIIALALSAYSLPGASNTTIGTITPTCTSTCGSISYTVVGSGNTANDGYNCANTTAANFTTSGASLKTAAAGYTNPNWDYACVQATPSGGSPFIQAFFLPQTTPQHTAVVAIGDTNTTGTSWAYPTYAQMAGPDYGWTLTTRGSGDGITACSALLGTVISDATGTINADYRTNPAYFLQFGTYEAVNYSESSYGTTFSDCIKAIGRWLAVPNANKQLAASVTTICGSPPCKSGTWSAYSTTGLSTGTCLQTSDTSTPASITHTITTVAGNAGSDPSANAYVWVGTSGASTGASVLVSVDGGGNSTVTLDNYQSAGVQAIWVPTLTNGSHTIKITANGLGSPAISLIDCAAGTPPRTWATKLDFAGLLPVNGTAWQAYDLDLANAMADLDEEMLDAIYAPTRNYVTAPGDMADATHLNAAGQIHLTQAMSENLYKCKYSVSNPSYSGAFSTGYTCPIFDEEGTTTNTVYDYSNGTATKPVASYNWYTMAIWPRTITTSSDGWRVGNTTGPFTIASGDIACCSYSGQTGLVFKPASSHGWGIPASSCGVPFGASANIPPFVVGTSFGLGFYMEDLVNWPSGVLTWWTESTEFWNNSPDWGYSSTTGLPRTSWTEEDIPDAGFGLQRDNLWTNVPNGTGVSGSDRNIIATGGFISGAEATGIVRGWFVENAVDGAETSLQYKNGSTVSASTPASLQSDWLGHNCIIGSANATSQAFVISYQRVWQRPL